VQMIVLDPDTHQLPHQGATTKQLFSKSDIAASLAKCVFMTKGAYGPHITAGKQDELSSKLANALMGIRKPQTKYLQLDNATNTGDIITSGCIFRMEEDGYRVELDGASFD
jgi:hypothetical protein